VENKIQITLRVNQEFDSLYKLGYFLIDINSVLNFCDKINKQTIEEANKQKKYNLGITSRYLNKDSLENIKIVRFQQGSLILEIICEIIVGVILIIIGKYINKGENKEKIEVIINNPQITYIRLVQKPGWFSNKSRKMLCILLFLSGCCSETSVSEQLYYRK
jgi:hypothetical protein